MLDGSRELQGIIDRLTRIYAVIDEEGLTVEAEELSCIIEELKKSL